MVDENPTQTGSLEKRNIIVETQIDENVLSPSAAKSVRFRLSKPSGYALGEVDDFIKNIVQPSIDWYAQILHQRDKTVHYLGGELDKAETDILNLKSQIQFLEYSSKIEEGISRNTDDKEVAALMARLESTEAEAEALKLQLSTSGARVDITQQEAYIAQITEQYNDLLAQYTNDVTALQEELAEAITVNPAQTVDNSEQEEYINQITEQYNELTILYETETEKLKAEIIASNEALVNAEKVIAASGDTSETDAYIAQITEQYTELMTRYETDLSSSQAELTGMQAELSSSQTALTGVQAELVSSQNQLEETQSVILALQEQLELAKNTPTEDAGPSQEITDYITQITEQYNELVVRYDELQAASGDTSETDAYIAQITEQYTELMTRYETDVAELQAEITLVSTANPSDRDEIAALKAELQKSREYAQSLDEHITILESKIASGSKEVQEKPAEPKRLPLITEETAKPLTNSNKYAHLPPGIRLDDLE
jgi:chromosome segregation ATPase